jgi:hypothetical protein
MTDVLVNRLGQAGSVDAETLSWMLDKASPEQRVSLVKVAPSLPNGWYLRLATQGSVETRRVLAGREDLPDDIRAMLQKDRSPRVVLAAGGTPKVRKARAKGIVEAKEVDPTGVDLHSLTYASWSDVETLVAHPGAVAHITSDGGDYLLSSIWERHSEKHPEVKDTIRGWVSNPKFNNNQRGEIISRIIYTSTRYGNPREFVQLLEESGLTAETLPSEWVKSSQWTLRQLAAAHPLATARDLSSLINDPDDDLDVIGTAVIHPNLPRKALMSWVKSLETIPDMEQLPDLDDEFVEELHDNSDLTGAIYVLAAIGQLSDEELCSALMKDDQSLVRQMIETQTMTPRHLIIAASSDDWYVSQNVLGHPKVNTEVRLAWASNHAGQVRWDLLDAMPDSRVLDLPLTVLVRLGAQQSNHSKLGPFNKAVDQLVKKYGTQALTVLDATSNSETSARLVMNAIGDSLNAGK